MEVTMQEVDDRIHDKMEGPLARIEASIDIINFKLGNIDEHLKVANHATAKNVTKIEEVSIKVQQLEINTPHSVINCPQNGTLQELKNYMDNIKGRKAGMTEMENKQLTAKQERRAKIIAVFQMIGVIITGLALLTSLVFGYINLVKNTNMQNQLQTIEALKK